VEPGVVGHGEHPGHVALGIVAQQGRQPAEIIETPAVARFLGQP